VATRPASGALGGGRPNRPNPSSRGSRSPQEYRGDSHWLKVWRGALAPPLAAIDCAVTSYGEPRAPPRSARSASGRSAVAARPA